MTAYIRSIACLDIVQLRNKAGFPWRIDCLKTALRILCLVLFGKLMFCTIPVLAATPAFNPARLKAFCPQGSEVADARQTKLLTLQEQVQIKRNVQGFMNLDAGARRSVGHPLGAAIYWERGYTVKFDEMKEVPADWVRYIAYRLSNICATNERVLAVIILDVADMAGRQGDMKFKASGAYLSPQIYWDAFSGAEVNMSDKEISPEQPVLLTSIPLHKDGNGRWVIEAKKVPILKKINKVDWRAEIEKRSKAYKCIEPSEKFSSTCDFNEKEKLMLAKYSRPAWSIYPKKTAIDVTGSKSINR